MITLKLFCNTLMSIHNSRSNVKEQYLAQCQGTMTVRNIWGNVKVRYQGAKNYRDSSLQGGMPRHVYSNLYSQKK